MASAAALLGSLSWCPSVAAASASTCTSSYRLVSIAESTLLQSALLYQFDALRSTILLAHVLECARLYKEDGKSTSFADLAQGVCSLSQLVQGPGQHGCAGLMPGQEESLDLVAQLSL